MKKISFWILYMLILIIFTSSVFSVVRDIVLEIKIPVEFEKITPDSYLLALTDLILVGENTKSVDVVFEYLIYDPNGQLVYKFLETKGGIVRIPSAREVYFPISAIYGTYTFKVIAKYNQIKQEATATFEVVEKKNGSKSITYYWEYFFAIFFIFIILSTIWQYKKFKYLENLVKKR